MLKKLSKLFLGLVVCAGSACVTPTHASSASSVIITHIQAASPAGAKDEMVAIYNNTPNEINISNWCLKNRYNVKFVCYTPHDDLTAYYLPAYAYVVVGSESYPASSGVYPEDISFIYPVTNQSSGSIVNSNDIISLVNEHDEVIDSHNWVSLVPSGKIMQRALPLGSSTYDTDLFAAWEYTVLLAPPFSQIRSAVIEPSEPEEPTEPIIKVPLVTELFPNPKGSDIGNEFIEIFNQDEGHSLNLDGYVLKVGAQLEKSYSFPSGTVLAPLEYRAFNNAEIKFTLLNTTSSVLLEKDGRVLDDTIIYTDIKEGESYSMLNGGWYMTGVPTPGEPNVIADAEPGSEDLDENEDDESDATTTSTQKPCAANQYRHPETNRCRLIATTSTSTFAVCTANQYRNLETNRCRNIATSTTTQAVCKVGQERNPETNRCRNIAKMTQANHGIKGDAVQTQSTGVSWYWWLGIGGIVALILGYAVWEWRDELSKVVDRIKTKFARIKK